MKVKRVLLRRDIYLLFIHKLVYIINFDKIVLFKIFSFNYSRNFIIINISRIVNRIM